MKTNKTLQNENYNPEPASKTICTIQLTRIGDILQTFQAAKLFKNQYPQFRQILVARRRFARPLSFLLRSVFDKIYYIDNSILVGTNPDSLNDSLKHFNDFIAKLKDEHISIAINLSFSKSSGYLTSLIPSEHKMGLTVDPSNNITIQDKWSQFIYSNVMGGPLNPFNLVDLYKTIYGFNQISEESIPTKFSGIQNIIIHPFASLKKKMWRINKWEEIIYQLLKNNDTIKITLAGGASDIEFSQKLISTPLLQKYKHQIINTVGETSLEELYNLLLNSDLFLGHDSMVGHMAAIANIPTITIALGTVRPRETTPYGQNNYTLAPKTKCFPCFPDEQCQLMQCHSDIPYQVIYNTINEFICMGEITHKYQTEKNSCFHLNSVNIFKSKTSPIGFQQLENLLDDSLDVNNVYAPLYRICWQFVLNDTEEPQQFPNLNDKLHQHILHSMQGLQHLYELSDFGKKYSRYILEEISSKIPRLEKIKDYSTKIDEIDDLQKLVKQTHPYLSPLIDLFIVQKGNLQGTNIVEITESSFIMYHDSLNTISVLYELIEKTINKHKSKNQIFSTSAENNTNR